MIVNGQAQQHIAIADRAVQYGDGCFTTIAFINGYLEFFDAHIQRLKEACEKLYIDFDHWSELKTCVFTSLKSADDCVVKIIISRGQGGRGYSPEGVGSASFILTQHQYPLHYYQWQKEGIRITQSPIQLARQPLLAGIKHLNRLEQVLIKHALLALDFDDAVVCDTQSNIIETSVGNLFWFKNNTWFTPDLTNAGVEGVMRNQVLSVLEGNQMKCQQVQADIDTLANAEEVFVCNSLMAIVPVMSLFNPITEKTVKYKFQQSKRLQAMLQSLASTKAIKV
jgi:4-amino-4-deoxychorismate lyase